MTEASLPDIGFVPIGPDEYDRVSHLIVAPDQIRFSGTVHEAFRTPEDGIDFHAITAANRIVGFFKIDRLYSGRIALARPAELGLRAFLIDLASQGKGLGTQAVRAIAPYLRQSYPHAPALVLTVNVVNPIARAAYLKGGFEDTGQIWRHGQAGPQNFLRMPLQ